MSEKEKRDLLEDIKKLPPEKQAYVAGVASGLLMGEGAAKVPDEEAEEADGGDEDGKPFKSAGGKD